MSETPTDSSRYELDKSNESDDREAPSSRIVMGVLWALFVAIAGGFLCGFTIDLFGWPGSILLWPLGAIGGSLARRITVEPSKTIGIAIVLACLFAFVLAEVCWLRWNTKQGEEGWLEALKWFPTFLSEYRLSALIAAVATFAGSWSGYNYAARRFRTYRIPV